MRDELSDGSEQRLHDAGTDKCGREYCFTSNFGREVDKLASIVRAKLSVARASSRPKEPAQVQTKR